MRRLWLVLVVLALPAPSFAATVERHPVYGGAEAFFGNCPVVEGPAGTHCVETYLFVGRTTTVVGGGPVARPKVPWLAFAATYRFDFTGGEPIMTDIRSGIVEGVDGVVVDTVHLATASARVRIPMSDGSTYAFDVAWRATSNRFVFGNNGPATGAEPIHTRCLTFNPLGHQKFVFARMTGTLNGQSIQSYTDVGFDATIFNNRFKYIEVRHGRCR